MAYRKIIRYSNNLELYEYEREPGLLGRRFRKCKTDDDNEDMGTDGKNRLSEQEKLGKRQDNARRASLAFRRLVASNLSGTELPLLITFTHKENITDITIGYKNFSSFVQALHYKYGKTFKYICIPEFQKRGAIHFHALFWGLPAEVFLQERRTRTIALMWGKGYVDMIQTDGHEKISGYLAKYMAKAFVDPRLKNQKAYTTSRNINRPITDSGCYSFGEIIEEYTKDGELIRDKEYDTKWLGKCRYRHYKASN